MNQTLKRLLIIFLSILSSLVLSAQTSQEDKDSLVSLLSAKSMQLIEKNDVPLRKVIGPARFFHNNTYLLCDTALWNVNDEMIHAMGNVKIIQNETVLTSDSLHYDIAQNLAMFRGALVQLQDKDRNTLRTNDLDYNTKDSVAYFRNGAAMRDKDGQLIESLQGEYSSFFKTFSFHRDVEMFTDSIFIKTNDLVYYTEKDSVTFGRWTNAWKDEYMLSAEAGWYARPREQFFFTKDVHGQNPDKEVWCDSLYYNRLTNNMEMLGKVQLIDSLRRATAMGGRMEYTDSISHLRMSRKPVVVGEMENQQGGIDSVWFGADTLIYRATPKFKLPQEFFDASKTRMAMLESDAVSAYRKKAAEAAAEAAKKAKEESSEYEFRPDEKKAKADSKKSSLPDKNKQVMPEKAKMKPALPEKKENRTVRTDSLRMGLDSLDAGMDSLRAGMDSLRADMDSLQTDMDSLRTGLDSLDMGLDSLKAPADTVVAVDSTNIGFFTGIRNVRVFKSDMQILTDSLEISDVDSLVRLYKNPIIWDQINRQYSSDSLYVLTKDSKLDKANLLSNAFIIVKEDSLCFDQIRSAEMMAYFDSTSALKRFDALGGANAIFYLKEDSTYATVNKSQAKMLSATFKSGELDKVFYFEASGSDAYPLAQMKKDDTILKGFDWMPEKRPKSRYDISTETIRPSQKYYYNMRPRNAFVETEKYFPGYVSSVYTAIEKSKQAKRRRQAMEQAREDSLARLASLPDVDSLALKDSLARVDSLATADSLKNAADSLSMEKNPKDAAEQSDSSLVAKDSTLNEVLTPEQLKEKKRQEKEEETLRKKKAREEKARLKLAKKEKHWAELDSLDAAKLKAKEEKKAAKIREKKRKALVKAMKQAQKDQARLDRYVEKYKKKKARQEARLAEKMRKVREKDKASEPDKVLKTEKMEE